MNERDMNRDGAVETQYTERLGLPNGMTMRWGKADGWYYRRNARGVQPGPYAR